jgi:hypothetical protein
VENFIIHLHLYFSNREAESTAFTNIKNLKENGFKILVTSPQVLNEKFFPYIDYFFFDRENQIFENRYEDVEPVIWWNDMGNLRLHFVVDGFQKHGLAVLRSMVKGCSIAKSIGYDYIIRFEYDDLFGPVSMNKVNAICNDILENRFNFYFYKNDYSETKKDISTHLMFYKCEKFLDVFSTIKNENDYKHFLEKINLPNKSIILEEFIYKVLDKSDSTIHFRDGNKMQEDHPDTLFNTHQAPFGLKDGILSDLMKVRTGDKQDPNKLCISAYNITSDETVNAHFDFYDLDGNFYFSKTLEISGLGYWKFDYIEDVKNISLVKIRHNNNDYHKSFKVFLQNNVVSIRDVQVDSDLVPELILNS